MVGASAAAVVVEVAAGLSDDVRPLIEAVVDSAMGMSVARNVESGRAGSVVLEGCCALNEMSINKPPIGDLGCRGTNWLTDVGMRYNNEGQAA